jgi:hypothetical protein
MLMPHESTVAHENSNFYSEIERKAQKESAEKKRVSRFHILSESEMVDKCF